MELKQNFLRAFCVLFTFKQEISAPDQLYSEVIEVEERLVFKQDKCQINKSCDQVTGVTGEKVRV